MVLCMSQLLAAIQTDPTPVLSPKGVGRVLSDYFWVFLVAMAISLAATPFFARVATSLNIVDRPVGRKVHRRPTPYLGGLAILGGWLTAVVLGSLAFLDGWDQKVPIIGIVIGATIATGIGLIDDLTDIRPIVKICGQLLAAYALILSGVGLQIAQVLLLPFHIVLPAKIMAAMSAAMSVLMVLGVCNSVNLLDGLDGLCSGVIVIMVSALTVLAITLTRFGFDAVYDPTRMIVCMAILGAVLGFLPYNFNPASIFMGDAGSMLLGFTLASLFILLGENSPDIRWFYAALMVFGLPAMDTTLAIIRRLAAGKSPMTPDAHHLHHQLIRQGLTVRQAVAFLYVLASFFALAGLMLIMIRVRYGLILAMFVLGIMALVTTMFQLHRMGPVDRMTDATISQLPRSTVADEANDQPEEPGQTSPV
jgi:UDP-GlcNAc:undecaprenyl-phosphate/decaprenyl-phosphate GlcNAc-1-phosphate transferase